MEVILEKGINVKDKELINPDEWFKQLVEAIREDLLSQEQIDQLLATPNLFLAEYTNDPEIAHFLEEVIIKNFFVSMIEMRERKKNKKKTLADFALEQLESSLQDTGNLSAVDLSQIYKNLKE